MLRSVLKVWLLVLVIGTKLGINGQETRLSTSPPTSTGPNKCPEIDYNGERIPETKLCNTVMAKCPDGLHGVIPLQCDCMKPVWSNRTDLSDCLSPSLGPLIDLVATAPEPLSVLRRFQENLLKLINEGKLRGGDVYGFVGAGERLMARALDKLGKSDRGMDWKNGYSEAFAKAIGTTGDYLMKDEARKAWNDLEDDKRIDRAARLMTLLQNMLVLRAHGLKAGMKDAFQFENYASNLQVKRMVSMDVPFLSRAVLKQIPTQKIEFPGFENAPTMELPNNDFLTQLAPSQVDMNTQLHPITTMFLQTSSRSKPPTASDAQDVKLGQFMYTKLGDLMTPKNATQRINSYVMGAFVNDPTDSIHLGSAAPVSFKFYHVHKTGVSNPKCVFWDLSLGSWSEEGCTLTETNSEFSKCSCVHLTSFAILMDFANGLEESRKRDDSWISPRFVDETLDWITLVGCTISIVSLLICVAIFTLCRSLYNSRTTIHRNLCLSLLMAELFFLFGIEETAQPGLCRAVAIALHYFFLCAFAWMLLEGYQLYLMLIKVFDAKSRTISYYLCGYIVPAVIVASSVLLSAENYGTPDYCWIDVRTPTIWTFVGPVALIVMFNSGVLFVALRTVLSVRNRDRSLAARVMGWLKGSAMLLFLLGITWVFGFLSAINVFQPVVAYIFTVLNSLQGAFIFFLHVVMNEKARASVARFLREGVCCAAPTSTTTSKNKHKADSSSFNKTNNFFALKKDRILQWWPLKSSNYNSKASSEEQKPADVRENADLSSPQRVQPVNADEEDPEMVARRRLLENRPTKPSDVVVERF